MSLLAREPSYVSVASEGDEDTYKVPLQPDHRRRAVVPWAVSRQATGDHDDEGNANRAGCGLRGQTAV